MAHKMEAILDYFKTKFHSEPKPRLHVGEVMGCWTYHTAIAEEIPVLEMALNTTTDNVLVKLINEAKEIAVEQRNILEKFMLNEGVSLSISSESKPKSDPNAIPLGAKSTDLEIANLLVAKVASNIVMCSTNITQSVRSDVGLMWIRFHTEKCIYGMELKTKMREHGWIKMPPYYNPPGAPNE
ncbi:DUF3231 family protein [Niallia nealsonii]|uniref:DUF3231 family protein n=1 Tax=Niallia nealsonii TaxID=115979 RepID=A0A2N0Z5C0_9BACI|nr:DUF3231 family protein [Niallia nealsonii]PKG24700.1 hypothetical protein CWS01_05455 [Niallia nealsonii]